MSDNTTRPLTSGGDTLRSDDNTTDKIQPFKLATGPSGVDAGVISRANPLPTGDFADAALVEQINTAFAERTNLLRNMVPRRRAGAAAPPPQPQSFSVAFTPLSLAGLALWLRADLGITTSSGLVTAWADQSGTGDPNRGLTQPTTSLQFDFNASLAAYNNKPALTTVTNTAAGCMMLGVGTWAASLPQPFTIFWAADLAVPGIQLIGSDSADSGQPRIAGGGSSYQVVTVVNFGLVNGVSPSTPANVACAVFNGASSALYVSNSVTPDATGTLGADAVVRTPLGGLSSSGVAGGGGMNGSVAEIIIVAGAADAATRLQVLSYMGTNYGLPFS